MNDEERIEKACEVFRWWAEEREMEFLSFDDATWTEVGSAYIDGAAVRRYPERYRLKPVEHVVYVQENDKGHRHLSGASGLPEGWRNIGVLRYTDNQVEPL